MLEGGSIFADPLALRIAGDDEASILREAAAHPERRRMRLFVAARTRFAEDALAVAIAGGVRQIVVLGAGLDTYAYRAALADDVRIFEVDRPATQAWKRHRLADAAIPIPGALTFAPVDFERETLAAGLAAAGFEGTLQTFFTWLGVVPYLTDDAITRTLEFIAGLAAGAQVVFDYSDPPESLSPERRRSHEQRAMQVAALGEAWIAYFEADMLRAKLIDLSFVEIEDLGPAQIAERYFPDVPDAAGDRGGHVLRAATAGRG